MKFSAPRSASPSPERRSTSTRNLKSRKALIHSPQTPGRTSKGPVATPARIRTPSRGFRFGVPPSDSEDDDDIYASGSDVGYVEDSSEDEDGDGSLELASAARSRPFYDSDEDEDEDEGTNTNADTITTMTPRALKRRVSVPRDRDEEIYLAETLASIKLQNNHHDEYEEWQRQTRSDALTTALESQQSSDVYLTNLHTNLHTTSLATLTSQYKSQLAALTARVNAHREAHRAQLADMRRTWDVRARKLWERIDAGIKYDVEKVKKREEEERRVKEEERKKKDEEERRKREVEERLRKEKEEAERRRKEEEGEQKRREEEERGRREEEARRVERERGEEGVRRELGGSTAEDDWKSARACLKNVKERGTKVVKSNREMKSLWAQGRRTMVPKIGQLTDDVNEINRISTDILTILSQPHPEPLTTSLLSTLSKSILLQAETEVTATKSSATPLARVTYNLLTRIPPLSPILFAKLVQRVGGWVIPYGIPLPSADYDGKAWKDAEERAKVSGYRKSESGEGMESKAEYVVRVCGVMRVYFHILRVSLNAGGAGEGGAGAVVDGLFRFTRVWVWFARMVGGARGMVEDVVAAELVYTALDVLGSDAKRVWGNQFVKMLGVIYRGVHDGFAGSDSNVNANSSEKESGGKFYIGGETSEGRAARARVEIEIERIMAEP